MPAEFSTGLDHDDDVPGMPAHPGYPAGTEPRRDPDLDNLDVDEGNDLEDLRAELLAEVAPSTTIAVPGRPAYAVRFRTDFTTRELDSLRKRARNKRFLDGIDGAKFSALLLGLTCLDVLRNGEPLGPALGVDGAVTFTTRELQELYGTSSADETVRKFYGLEGHVDATARRLMAEAGWGDEADVADPTE